MSLHPVTASALALVAIAVLVSRVAPSTGDAHPPKAHTEHLKTECQYSTV
jgi:hypothetical protein